MSISTHPIQYHVPLWQALAAEGSVPFEVWYLSDHGSKVSYDPKFDRSFAWDIDILAGYPYRFLPVKDSTQLNSFSQLRLTQPLDKLFQEKNVKALWVQGWQVMAYWQAVWQAHREGIPVWLRGESHALKRTPWPKYLLKQFVLKQFFNRVSHFFYIGSANRHLYQQYGVPNSKLISAPYCVDNQRFAQSAQKLMENRTEIRQELGIPQHAFCFLFCGKFYSVKRPLDLLKAVSHLISINPAIGTEGRIHILMVGSGEMEKELHTEAEKLAERCGRPLVSFVGFLNQAEISKAYVAADCLVLPSASETWGLVVNEALACGRPAIVTDMCGCANDLARPLGETFVYPCGNVIELANRLNVLVYGQINLPNQEIYNSLLQQHNVNTVVTNVIETYSKSA